MSLPNTDSLMRKIQGYYKPYNEVQYGEVRNVIDRRVKSETGREILWNDIINKHKGGFPPLVAEINRLLDDAAGETYNQNHAPTQGLGMSAAYIYTTIQEIREKQAEGEHITNADIDFLATWGKIEYYWETLIDAGKSPNQVCECIKSMIERGETVPVINTNGADNIEPYILGALKNIVVNKSARRSA